MVTRIVLVKLKDQWATPASRAEIAAHTRKTFLTLPGVRGVTVGIPSEAESERSWDLSIVVEFNHLDDVEPYKVSPAHRAYVDDYLKPKMEVLKAWNFTPVGG